MTCVRLKYSWNTDEWWHSFHGTFPIHKTKLSNLRKACLSIAAKQNTIYSKRPHLSADLVSTSDNKLSLAICQKFSGRIYLMMCILRHSSFSSFIHLLLCSLRRNDFIVKIQRAWPLFFFFHSILFLLFSSSYFSGFFFFFFRKCCDVYFALCLFSLWLLILEFLHLFMACSTVWLMVWWLCSLGLGDKFNASYFRCQ